MSRSVQEAKDAALGLLAVRARTRSELLDRLARKGYDVDVRERAVADLEHAGLVDDESFARLWADERVRLRPVGRRRLVQELRRKGVGTEIIDRVVIDVFEEHPERELAARVLERWLRRGRRDAGTDRKRAAAHLLRRGFGYDVVNDCIRAMMEETDGERADVE